MFPRSRPRRTCHWSKMLNCEKPWCSAPDIGIRSPNSWCHPALAPLSTPYLYSIPPITLISQFSSPTSCVVRPFDEYGAAPDTAPKSWGIPFFSQPDYSPEEREDVTAPVVASAVTSGISKEKISAFVRDNLLKNHNIAYLPDYVEGALYENAVTALMALLEGVITTSKIEVLGHVINFSIRPIDTPSEETETAPSSQASL